MKLVNRLSILLLSSALVIFPYLKNPTSVLAQTFNPSFGVTLSDNTPGLASDIEFRLTQPAGDELVKNTIFNIPAGWQVADGSSFGNGVQLGSGSFTADFGAGPQTFNFVIRNDTNLLGHKVHVVADFSPLPLTFDAFIDGDSSTGYSIPIPDNGLRPNSPTDLIFTLNGTAGGTNFLVNPNIQGDYEWSGVFTSLSDIVVTRLQTLSIPGSATPVGSNVAVSLNDGSSVVFDNVSTAGVTTIATSTTPPPEGSGQFQLSGGLYYDYNTTATFACPCTITVPYDPVATPDPRIYHLESGVWVDVTTNVDTVNHLVTGVVSSFSYFAPGQPNHTAEWLSPVRAFNEQKDQPFDLNKNQALPLNLIVRNSSGDVIQPSGLKVELRKVTSSTTNTFIISAFPVLTEEGDYLKTKINFRDLGSLITPDEYFLRVIIDGTNTTLAPDVHFTIS